MTIQPKNIPPKTISLIVIIIIIALIIGLSINPIRNYLAKKEVQAVNEILNYNSEVKKSLVQCRTILAFDKNKVLDNEFFNEKRFDEVREECDERFNFGYVETNEENCKVIISEPNNYFKRNYIFSEKEVCEENKNFDPKADGLDFKCDKKYSFDLVEDKKLECAKKYLNPTFSTGSFFSIDNDFKSSIIIDFNLAFFRDIGEENSDEYLENREEAKERLANLIQISPYEFDVAPNDIYLYPNKAILNLNLAPLTEYSISLASFETDNLGETEKKTFTFTTPENKYFGMRVLEPLTIYTKNNLPTFQIIDYNTDKMKTTIQVCPISVDNYAKVEVYLKTGNKEEANEFFQNGILTCVDTPENCAIQKRPAPKENEIELEGCINQEVIYKDSLDINKNEFKRVNINSVEMFGQNVPTNTFGQNTSPNGLYLVRLPEDTEFNGRINKPILFGVVNSHITMKVSRDGEGFFFVNDLEGNPLPNQEISIYLNDFQEINSQWNYEKGDYDTTYNLPIEGNVFSEPIIVGKTGEDGVLKVDLKEKISDFFGRTFEDEWSANWSGIYKSFFVESHGIASGTTQDLLDNPLSSNSLREYQSYLTSTWNAGIAPWNFGYTTDWTNDENQIQLAQWGDDRLYNAHIYTDRILYLPGESVNIKTVIRAKEDLSIPENTEFTLKVNNSKGEEILNKNFKVNEYGSYADTLTLRDDFPLGSYSIYLLVGDNYIYGWGFNVEVFKNPKFKNEITLETIGLNGELVNIVNTTAKDEYYGQTNYDYKGNFTIRGSVISNYYNGGVVKNADFTYKVYKQYYYENNYWDNCYYGCYWEPAKEFYTEGNGKLDENGFGNFEIPIEFESSYNDYKYVVEVTITDDAGDTITGSNSIIARLPAEYKKYNSDLDIYFESDSKFAKVGTKTKVSGGLNVGNWIKDYNDKYVFAIKRKEYLNTSVTDVNGYERDIQKVNEVLEKVMFINYDNFKLNGQGKLELNYTLDKNAEYVFEYGKISDYYASYYLGVLPKGVNVEDLEKYPELKTEVTYNDLSKIIDDFNENKTTYLENEVLSFGTTGDNVSDVMCELLGICEENVAVNGESKLVTRKLNLSDFIDGNKYFTIVTYDDTTASNPIENDNKLRVIAEKVSYNIGEKAKVLVRLPYSNTKVLWTIEKNGVTEYEYIDVPGNVFFKEFIVDDSFTPNAYIGVEMVPTSYPGYLLDSNLDDAYVPKVLPLQYKVGYTEIVVDKTDKKAFIDVKIDSNLSQPTYKPRDEVNLDISVKDKNGKALQSELTVMVVDDSLISLMGNVDLNTLEKIFQKLPFSVQTSLTNIAMLKNYYFSRIGIVGGSGADDLKGGDSAVSTRNIFKNTAYFNPSVVTDAKGKAQVKFTLPDNLTNFRVMVVSNSKDNHFGYEEKFIQVRKNIVAEDRTPLILRQGDNATIGANIFYNGLYNGGDTTRESMNLKVSLNTHRTSFLEFCSSCIPEQTITLKPGESKFVSWDRIIPIDGIDEIKYTISVIGNNVENSDKIENTIKIAEDPVLVRNLIKKGTIFGKDDIGISSVAGANGKLNLEQIIPENTDLKNTIVELIFSNSKLAGIEKILKSLIEYPYGCIEQTVSSTLPNVIARMISDDIGQIISDDSIKEIKGKLGLTDEKLTANEVLDKNIEFGVNRIISMQNSDGGFAYWQGNSTSDLHITPYVLRSLVYMKNAGVSVSDEVISKAVKYLKENIEKADNSAKVEIYWTLASLGEKLAVYDVKEGQVYNLPNIPADTTLITIDVSKLGRHDLIAYTYGKVLETSPLTPLLSGEEDEVSSKNIPGRNANIPEIRNLIEKIKGQLTTKTDDWYRDNLSDRATFVSLLIDFGDENDDAYIEELVDDLYSYDWSSYWYSTQSKNNAFSAFHKYLEKTGVNNVAEFNFEITSHPNPLPQDEGKAQEKSYSLRASLGGKEANIKRFEFNLDGINAVDENGASKVFDDVEAKIGDTLALNVENTGNSKVYVDYIIHQYPEDKTKVEPYSNGMTIKREIFEVLDENLLSKCSGDYSGYLGVSVISEEEERKLNKIKKECEEVLKLKTDNVFEKGKLYKAKITASFSDEKTRRNLTIEDYLPGSFRVINSGFKTESSVTDTNNNWSWSYVEYRPDVVMANASYVWEGSKDNSFEYYFRPEFEGTYLQPPVVGYLMYEPEVRANGGYREVEVK